MKIITQEHQLREFAKTLLIRSGANPDEATIVAKILAWCDFIGRDNQGVWRLPILTKRIESGLIKSPCHYESTRHSPALASIDGKQGMGHYLAYEGMTLAIELAKKTGIAMISIKDSNFFGAGAYYIEQAASANMIGIAASNSFPKVAAYQGIHSVLGTNPLAFSAPRKNGRHLLLDMATSASAGSSIRKCIEKGEKLPSGIAVDQSGKPITNPEKVETGTLLPFGGAKGYGLSLMVEILTGIISGSGFSHDVKSMYKNLEESGNNGHCLIAIDIGQLIPLSHYYERMETFVKLLRQSGNNENNTSHVLLPGEVRWNTYDNHQQHGLPINTQTVKELRRLAEHYQIPFTL